MLQIVPATWNQSVSSARMGTLGCKTGTVAFCISRFLNALRTDRMPRECDLT
jgi:hypothetical protein